MARAQPNRNIKYIINCPFNRLLPMSPVAFLCHASEDNELASRIAASLYSSGIQTFFDEWEIRAGDSVRQRIDQGLADCTHFLVLVTERSIVKPWVNAEIDAAFVKKVEGNCRFIPLRCNLHHAALPPLLKALHSPEISFATFDEQMKSLVADIYGISRRPPLGPTPEFLDASLLRSTGLSQAALKIAQYFVRTSEYGHMGQLVTIAALRAELDLTSDDAIDGLDELERIGMVYFHKVWNGTENHNVGPEPRLFAHLDKLWMDWYPQDDALTLASRLLTNPGQGVRTSELAKEFGWQTRRLNPALSVLLDANAVKSAGERSHPELRSWVQANDETRRYVKARGQ